MRRTGILALTLILTVGAGATASAVSTSSPVSMPGANSDTTLTLASVTIDRKNLIDTPNWTFSDQGGSATWNKPGQWHASYMWSVPTTIPASGASASLALNATVLNGNFAPLMGIWGSPVKENPSGVELRTTPTLINKGQSGSGSRSVPLVPGGAASAVLSVGLQDGPTFVYTYKAAADPCARGIARENNCGTGTPTTVTATVPPGGTAAAASPALPAKAKSINVSVEEDAELVSRAEALAVILPGMSNNDRLLTCASYGILYSDVPGANLAEVSFKPALSALRTKALMSICFEMVEFLAHQGANRAQTRQSGCSATLVNVKVAIKKTKKGYLVKPIGKPRQAKAGPLSVGCTETAAGIDLSVSARGKAPLRNVVGPTVDVGILSTATSGAASPVSVVFGVPR